MKKHILLLSCEHAVNTIPKSFQAFFASANEVLQTHRGLDLGAFDIAKHLQQTLGCELFATEVSRLLIDCNRSLHHSHCLSEFCLDFTQKQREALINQYYLPYRQELTTRIHHYISQGFQVWHLSIHSFTPILNNQVRQADIGLLYDPKRPSEKHLASCWQQAIKECNPNYRVRKNYPYKGISDGFTSSLRKHFSDAEYVGLEVESNQALVAEETSLNTLKKTLTESLIRISR